LYWWDLSGSFRFVLPTATSRSGDGNGSGFNNTALTTLKMAVFAPIPSASVTTATRVNPGDLRSWRKASFKSFMLFGAQSLNYINARSPRRGQHRRDYCDRQQHKRRGRHCKNARHSYVGEIAARYTRQNESE